MNCAPGNARRDSQRLQHTTLLWLASLVPRSAGSELRPLRVRVQPHGNSPWSWDILMRADLVASWSRARLACAPERAGAGADGPGQPIFLLASLRLNVCGWVLPFPADGSCLGGFLRQARGLKCIHREISARASPSRLKHAIASRAACCDNACWQACFFFLRPHCKRVIPQAVRVLWRALETKGWGRDKEGLGWEECLAVLGQRTAFLAAEHFPRK